MVFIAEKVACLTGGERLPPLDKLVPGRLQGDEVLVGRIYPKNLVSSEEGSLPIDSLKIEITSLSLNGGVRDDERMSSGIIQIVAAERGERIADKFCVCLSLQCISHSCFILSLPEPVSRCTRILFEFFRIFSLSLILPPVWMTCLQSLRHGTLRYAARSWQNRGVRGCCTIWSVGSTAVLPIRKFSSKLVFLSFIASDTCLYVHRFKKTRENYAQVSSSFVRPLDLLPRFMVAANYLEVV